MRKLLVALIISVTVYAASAAEVTFTGWAGISGGDVRTAQKNSLNNALLGGIRRYVRENAPEHKGEITTDYFMFINSYVIVARAVVNNSVQTTVRMILDDIIDDDMFVYMAGHMNSAVFFVSGLPVYVPESEARDSLKITFDKYQFSTNDQVAFEQEVLDRSKRLDVLTAFQAVSSQYLFDLKFDLKSFKSGESCILASEVSYVHTGNISKTVPVISTEVTVENEDPAACVMEAVTISVDAALAHVRDKLVAAPGERREEYTYNLRFENITDLRSINELMDTLQRRRLINKSELLELYGEEAVFTIDCYLKPVDLAGRISELQFAGVVSVDVEELADSYGSDYTADDENAVDQIILQMGIGESDD